MTTRIRSARLSTALTLPYVEVGADSGIPVIFLHGYVDSHRFFEPALPHLPSGIHAYMVTQRGHGDADKPASGYSLEDFSNDIAAFMDAVGLSRAVLVGHSSGGYIAQRFAIDFPQRTLGLVLIGTPRSLQNKRAPFADAVDAMTDPVTLDFVRQTMGTLPLRQPVPEQVVEEMYAECAKAPARVWKATLSGLTEAIPPTETGTITAPTLILWGKQDDFLGQQDQEAMAAAIPGSQLVGYSGAGHIVLWDVPESVVADIVGFALSLNAD